MTEEIKTKQKFSQNLITTTGKILPFFLGLLALIFVIFFLTIAYYENEEGIKKYFQANSNQDIIYYLVSWIILFVISIIASLQISEILKSRKDNKNLQKANSIAIIIGLISVIMLFKQPYLDMLFAEYEPGGILKTILFASGGVSGWMVWYLKQIKNYGEFFNVFLYTMVIGICWYARLTAPEEVQLTVVAFISGSLFRIAKDYIDAEKRNE